MAFFNFTVDEEKAGVRLDKFLAEELPQFSRSFISHECRLKINGESAKPSAKIHAGDEIHLAVPQLKDLEIEAEDIPLEIIFEDDDILVVDKPAGMVVHPTDRGGHVRGTLVNALLFRSQNWPGEKTRPGLVHRIDRDTSGLLVVAKTAAAKEKLTADFANRKIEKKYLALVSGKLKTPRGRIDAPIGRDPVDRVRRKVIESADSREAITEFETLENFDAATLVRVNLLTGRTHQIRVHFASLGHSLVGDEIYGFRNADSKLQPPRMFLHSESLAFTHPTTGEHVEFTAPLPAELEKFLEKLRK